MDTIAFPIRFVENHIATLAERTDAYYNQLISVALQTEPGEYAIDLDFGIKDMTFTDMSNAAIRQTLTYYYPEIFVDNVRIAKDVSTSNVVVDISYNY